MLTTLGLGLSAPLRKNAVSALQILCKLLSFTLEDSWRDDQYLSITKDSIYEIYYAPFTTVVDWPDIWCFMEVRLFYIWRYCVFTWWANIQGVSIKIVKSEMVCFGNQVASEVKLFMKSKTSLFNVFLFQCDSICQSTHVHHILQEQNPVCATYGSNHRGSTMVL